ncbi:MAG: hypothetical protein AAF667_05585 [Pseudomonadota bacterium]
MEEDEGPVIGQSLVAQQQEACEDQGGRFAGGPREGTQVCYLPNADANEPCSNATDCDGLCLARSRSCSPVTPIFGCVEILLAGGLPVTQCFE